jgi:hypothetical protein
MELVALKRSVRVCNANWMKRRRRVSFTLSIEMLWGIMENEGGEKERRSSRGGEEIASSYKKEGKRGRGTKRGSRDDGSIGRAAGGSCLRASSGIGSTKAVARPLAAGELLTWSCVARHISTLASIYVPHLRSQNQQSIEPPTTF